MNVELILHPMNADVNVYLDDCQIKLSDPRICFRQVVPTLAEERLFPFYFLYSVNNSYLL